MNNRFFHDPASGFLIPAEPDPGDVVTLRVRIVSPGDTEVLAVLFEGKEKQTLPGGGAPWSIPMKKSNSFGRFAVYECHFRIGAAPVRYSFQCRTDGEWESSAAYVIFPGFHVPGWMKGAVLYQIFPDRFCSGDSENDVKTGEYLYLDEPVQQVGDWEQTPADLDVGRFYGGDLCGVRKKLDYLQYLGIEGIYFNPLFVSPSNHKYDTQDYDHIDPHLTPGKAGADSAADEAALAEGDRWFACFMREVHERGMRVILDGVFNHCGSFHKWMDREGYYAQHGIKGGAYGDPESPYRSFFRFTDREEGAGAVPQEEPFCQSGAEEQYECWWDVPTLPKLNYEGSEALCREILRIARKWVSEPYCADGWRLDVAADLGHSQEWNHAFWRRFRDCVKAVSEDKLILAEHYGDPSSWLTGGEWDTVMNYDAFMDPVSLLFTGMEKHSDRCDEEACGDTDGFWTAMESAMQRLPANALYAAMNQLSNHDHSRFLTRTNHKAGRAKDLGAGSASEGIDKAVFMQAVALQMTWPGAPTIYYGDEAGQVGYTDPDNRRTYPWGNEDHELIAFHKELIRLRKELPALREGALLPLDADPGILAYARFFSACTEKAGKKSVIVVFNLHDEDKKAEIPVWEAEIGETGGEDADLRAILLCCEGKYYAAQSSAVNGTQDVEDGLGRLCIESANGVLHVLLPPQSAVVFIQKRNSEL